MLLNSDSITLEYKMVPGEVLKYKTIITTKQNTVTDDGPQDTESYVEMLMDQRATNVKDEQMDIEMYFSSGFVARDGQHQELPVIGQTITMTMNRDGNILHTSLPSDTKQPTFPHRRLKIGDSWQEKNAIDIPIGDNQTKQLVLDYTYTLTRLAYEQGCNVAVIEVTAPETKTLLLEEQGQKIFQTLTASGTTVFAYEAGRMVSSRVNTKTVISVEDEVVSTVEVLNKVELQEVVPSKTEDTQTFSNENFIIGM
ncbi:hypothetical protein IJT10_04780 [bacterium]|nr:hypothetical protein [bacterium]